MSISTDTAGKTQYVRGPLNSDIQFVNDVEFGYTSGQCIRFLSIEDLSPNAPPKDLLLQIPFRRYGFFRTVPGKVFFGLANLDSHSPLVYIYKFPEFTEVSRIDDDTVTELLDVAFTYTKLLVILTGQPDCQITIWNWDTQQQITKYVQNDLYAPNLRLSLCPVNWRNFCVADGVSLRVFTVDHGIEEDQTKAVLCERPTQMPYSPKASSKHFGDLFQSINCAHPADFTSITAWAQVPPFMAENFTDEVFQRSRLTPSCNTWHVDGALYIGTTEGYLLYSSLHQGKMEPVVLGCKTSGISIAQIVSFKEGLAFLDSNGLVHVYSMPAPTEIQSTRVLDERFSAIWNSPKNLRWFGLTTSSKLSVYHPHGSLQRLLLNRDELSPYISMEKLCDGSLLTPQKDGILTIWNKDNEPQSVFQTAVQAVCVTSSPVSRCVVLGSVDGYLHILDCTNSQKDAVPRHVHSFRLFGKAVRKVAFDTGASVLMVTGEDDPNTLMILSGLPSRKWAPLGVVKLSEPIHTFRGLGSERGEVFVLAGCSSTKGKTVTDLSTFRLSSDLLKHPEKFFATPLHDFSKKLIFMTKVKLRVPFSAFDMDRQNTMFAVTATKHLVQTSSETWEKMPDLVQRSDALPFSVHRLSVLAGGQYLLLTNKQGCTEIRSAETLSVVAFDHTLFGKTAATVLKQRGAKSSRLFHLSPTGEIICRSFTPVDDLVTDPWIKLSDQQRAEITELTRMHTKDEAFLQPCSVELLRVRHASTSESESWLAMKTRVYVEAQALEDSKFVATLRNRTLKTLKRLKELHYRNMFRDSLERVLDEAFEIVDENWAKLRKQREKGISNAKTEASLELIENELHQERLLARYWTPLTTKYQSVHSVIGETKIKNFPIPHRGPEIVLTDERAKINRLIDRHLDQKLDRTDQNNRRISVKVVDFDTIFASGQDYAKQIIRHLAGPDSEKTEFFEGLYPDDMVTSRFQRIQQTAILRECALLVKEEFNARFHVLHDGKATLLRTLEHDFELIKRKFQQNEENTPTLPPVKLHLTNDENPGQVLYQVTHQQVTEYMDKSDGPLPFFLDHADLNYELIKKAAHEATDKNHTKDLTPRKSLSALRLASRLPKLPAPSEEILVSPEEILRTCQKYIEEFESSLAELSKLKERAAFAVALLEIRAMYLRLRTLFMEELKAWTDEVRFKSDKIATLTEYVKHNAERAKKMYGKIEKEYEEISKRDSQLDHFIKRELHDLSELDGKRLVTLYRKRPHLFRGLKQAVPFNGHTVRPRTAELKENITKEFFSNLRILEDPSLRPDEIDYKLWHQYNEYRRKKMDCEMEFWIKHMELDLYQGVSSDYASLEQALQAQHNDAQRQLGDIDTKLNMFERNADLILTLTHGQIEAELLPFGDYPKKLILTPLKRIEETNSKLRTECRDKLKVLHDLVKYREGILLLEWEREIHREKIADYEYEKHFISSQAAPLAFRRLVGKDFAEYRETQYMQLKKNVKQQKVMFKKDLEIWKDKLHQLQQKQLGLENERHNADASMKGLSAELIERHATAEDIGVHADAAESDMRRNIVWRQLRLQASVKSQKKRMESLKEELWRWQQRTFPAIYQDLRNL